MNTMNLPLDIAVCIGGPCAQKSKCARWVVYDSMKRAKQDGKTDFDPRVIFTTPPFTYDDGCFYFMPSTLESNNES